MKKQTKNATMQSSGWTTICMVFCILVFLPFNIALVVINGEKNEPREESVFSSELEWQVLHLLAYSMPISYEQEALKAQAVIVRTNLLTGELEEDNAPLLHFYKSVWGDAYEENCEKLMNAVKSTEGMYLESDGKPVYVPFFRLSNGSTRDAVECKMDSYSYLAKVTCKEDLPSKQYLAKKLQDKTAFCAKINGLLQTQFTYEQLQALEVTYTQDSAGYVLYVNFGNYRIGGEVFRQAFSLPSSDFSITYLGENVELETRGIGSGFGFSQYCANEMAKQGKDFFDLLNYFFTNIAISKTE